MGLPAAGRTNPESLMPPTKSPAPKPFTPPADPELYVEVGDPVEWYAGGDLTRSPVAAVVTQVGFKGSVELNCFHPHLAQMLAMDGVLHMSDPQVRKEWHEAGGWRHRPLTVATRRVLIDLGFLKWDGESRYVAATPAKVQAADPPKP